MKNKKLKHNGFTLIELMIAVVIIGILAAVSVPSLARSAEKAKNAQARTMLREMREAALSYFSDKRTFAGVTMALLEEQINANFYSGDIAADNPANENQDWYYNIDSSTASQIVLSATRRGGKFSGQDITLSDNIIANQHEAWGGTYPWQDPAAAW